jgi:hypothetical protein
MGNSSYYNINIMGKLKGGNYVKK